MREWWLESVWPWCNASGAFVLAYSKVLAWVLVLPGSAIVVALTLFGVASPEDVLKFIRSYPGLIFGISGGVAGLITSIKDRKTLLDITTPRIKMGYHGTAFSFDGETNSADGVWAYLKLTGLSRGRVDFDLYCTGTIVSRNGNGVLVLQIGKGTHRFLTKRESCLLPILFYAYRFNPENGNYDTEYAPIRCLVAASHIHADSTINGDEFIVTISAHGDMEPVDIQLRCWREDHKFCVEEVKPERRPMPWDKLKKEWAEYIAYV